MNVVLTSDLLQALIAEAKARLPEEMCGLIAGRGNAAERFLRMTNILSSATAYEMDPAELAPALRGIREAGEELVAIVHSHPRGPAELSERDLGRAYYPDAAYIVVSMADPERPKLRGFRVGNGQAVEIELHVIV